MTVRRWTDAARKLRREMSLPEVLLWRELRGGHVKFRRQHAIGDYVLDFYCAATKLAVEIDGRSHDMGDRWEGDAIRDAWLTARGVTVVRIPATEVFADPGAVAASLTTTAAAVLPARGEVARSAGGGGDRRAAAFAGNARASATRSPPPPSAFGCHLPASGEDQGISSCR